MTIKTRTGETAERYIDATVDLIAERGTSVGVNLREVSRRIGFSHTNAYNYFSDFDDLLWQAFRRVLKSYVNGINRDLTRDLSPRTYFRRLFRNLVEWSVENPGFHRFISTDPLDPKRIPEDIHETVMSIKAWIIAVLRTIAGERLDTDSLTGVVEITVSYLDGEMTNLVTGRQIPGEDIAGRVVDNVERVFVLLTATQHNGLRLSEERRSPNEEPYPELEV